MLVHVELGHCLIDLIGLLLQGLHVSELQQSLFTLADDEEADEDLD